MKVEFSALPKTFSGNVAVFVADEKQLLPGAQAIDKEVGGTIARAIAASRFTGARSQSLTLLGQSGDIARLTLLGIGKPREFDARSAEALGGLLALIGRVASDLRRIIARDKITYRRMRQGR